MDEIFEYLRYKKRRFPKYFHRDCFETCREIYCVDENLPPRKSYPRPPQQRWKVVHPVPAVVAGIAPVVPRVDRPPMAEVKRQCTPEEIEAKRQEAKRRLRIHMQRIFLAKIRASNVGKQDRIEDQQRAAARWEENRREGLKRAAARRDREAQRARLLEKAREQQVRKQKVSGPDMVKQLRM